MTGHRDVTLIIKGIEYVDPSRILTNAHSGQGGDLIIKTNHLNIAAGLLSASALGEGDSGNITIQANTVSISDGGLIASSSTNEGKAGNIVIIAGDTLSISGRRKGSFTTSTGIKFEDNQSSIISLGFQNAGGDVSISARTLRVDNEAAISASTLGMVEISGSIRIDTEDLYITQGGYINNSNGFFLGRNFVAGAGPGGAIQIKAKNITIDSDKTDLPTGIFSDTYSSGTGGHVEIQTNNLAINNDGAISARSNDTGNAGSLTVQADTIKLTNQGKISTETENAAGGNITVKTPHLLYLHKGAITTSVGTGKGDGGNITIENPQFIVMNNSQIKAQADAGHGGNIRIVADQFIKSPDSLISASSRLGLDGVVHVDSPDIDVSGALLGIPAEFFDASNKLKSPCTIAQIQNPSTFIVKRVGGSAPLPSDWQSNQLVLIQPEDEQKPNSKTKPPSPITSKEVSKQLALKVALLTGCQSGF